MIISATKKPGVNIQETGNEGNEKVNDDRCKQGVFAVVVRAGIVVKAGANCPKRQGDHGSKHALLV